MERSFPFWGNLTLRSRTSETNLKPKRHAKIEVRNLHLFTTGRNFICKSDIFELISSISYPTLTISNCHFHILYTLNSILFCYDFYITIDIARDIVENTEVNLEAHL